MAYHHLLVYQKSYELALEMHKLSLTYPRVEQYELASQIRRSSRSVPSNIVEGTARQSGDAEVRRFLRMSLGSCDETRLWLNMSKDLGYIDGDKHAKWVERYCEVGKMLTALIKRL